MKKDILRKDRKKEHIEHYLKSTYKNTTLFKDIYIEHNALPELNFSQIDTRTNFLGKAVEYPIMINAITGGTEFSWEINRELSEIAKKYDIPIAVGSQTIALKDEDSYKSFEIVRETIGSKGVILANLSGRASLEQAKHAIEILDADGIQLHLNTVQELVMGEGEREFQGVLGNIERIVVNIEKPVIVKEVGFGISEEVARKLYNIGARYIDVSGKGGSNFIEIEDRRRDKTNFEDIYSWGIPTALSLIQCKDIGNDLKIISSGGIKTSLDILKSLILGADMVGIAGMILRKLMEDGYEAADKYIEDLIYKLKILMILTGSKDIDALKGIPYSVKGELKDLIG